MAVPSLSPGHYTAYCKTDDWALYNDCSVSKACDSSFQDGGGYILFYQRKEAA